MAHAHQHPSPTPPSHQAAAPPQRPRGPLEALAARLAGTQLGAASTHTSSPPPVPPRVEKPLPDVPQTRPASSVQHQQSAAPGYAQHPHTARPAQRPQHQQPYASAPSPYAAQAQQHRRPEEHARRYPAAPAEAARPLSDERARYAQQQAQAGPSRLAAVQPSASNERGPLPRPPPGSVWAHASQLVAARPQPYASTSSASLPASLRPAQAASPSQPLPRPPSVSSADDGAAYGARNYPNPWESSLITLHPHTGRPVSLPSTPVRAPAAPPRRARTPSPSPPPTSARTARASPAVRGSSASPAPAGGNAATKRCAGIRKDGVRCARRVRVDRPAATSAAASRTPSPTKARTPSPTKARTPSPTKAAPKRGAKEVIVISDDEASDAASDDDEDDLLCHQHVREINRTPGMHLPLSRGFLAFDALLLGLSASSAARIRALLGRPLSAADAAERGYLYIYSLRAMDDRTHECLKVGRAKSALKRVGEWRAQCASKQPVLRAIVPSDESQSLIPGAAALTAPGLIGSHLWERLVHLELRDVDVDAWSVQAPCADCGARHREIFRLPRAPHGAGRGKPSGGFELALAVVRKWERVVRRLAPE